jgi:hypothetical protein
LTEEADLFGATANRHGFPFLQDSSVHSKQADEVDIDNVKSFRTGIEGGVTVGGGGGGAGFDSEEPIVS